MHAYATVRRKESSEFCHLSTLRQANLQRRWLHYAPAVTDRIADYVAGPEIRFDPT
jgi:hypothetical protein